MRSRKDTLALRNLSVQRLVAHARTPLYRNGYALILSAATTSGLGVLYWMLATRYYPAEVVGLNSALISAMLFVAGVAQLSLVSVITRFLPRAGHATGRLIGVAYALTLTTAALAGLLFVLGTRIWSPELAFLGASPLFTLWFVLATMAWCIFTLQDSVLAAMKQAVWVPIENTIFAVAKIALLLAWPAARYGIFASWTIPGAVVLLPVNYLIFGRLLPRHTHASAARAEPLLPRRIAGYAASNYLGSMLSLAVNTLLPLLVLHQLGARANAYFAQPWLIASSLQLVVGNMAVSLTVEAATDRERLAAYTRRALVHTARLLAPLVALLLIAAPHLLGLFGGEYAAEGAGLLRLLALGALPNLVNMLYLSVARVRNRVGAIVVVQAALCALALGLSYPLLQVYGITGVGIAWLTSQTLVAGGIALATLRPRTPREFKMETTMLTFADALAGARGLFVSMLLIALLALREFAQAAGGTHARTLARGLLLAIVPLLVLFGLALTLRLIQEQGGPPAHASAPTVLVLATAMPALVLPTATQALGAPSQPTAAAETFSYTVSRGDLLYDLALRFNTSVDAIVALNPHISPDSLVIGDRLRIPVMPAARAERHLTAGPGEMVYAVRAGDTLYDLAPRFHTSVEAIAALNPQVSPHRLMVGQELRIPIAQLQPTQERKP
ncbi:MAG TPA: LysM domain-containing protein [Roseiflexaceae bacterium]|nr:LysM domain-containing protein [Roseiflexaceae bacterium]